MMAHQFHAKLVGFALGMRVRRRQGEATPMVWGELLLLQLGVQATRECHLGRICRSYFTKAGTY